MGSAAPPRVAHLLFRFDTGGLENGVVNLINALPAERFRHVIIALTEVAPAFARRITRSDVEFIALNKPPGQTWWQYPRLHRLLRQLQPAVMHTRNLAALECQVPAWTAGVPVRVHGEHGWDVSDLGGVNVRYRMLRRLYRPFVQRWVALSGDLHGYLTQRVGVPAPRVQRICNGVDTQRFHPAAGGRALIEGCPFSADPGAWIVGTVGRMQTVKNQVGLAQAFVQVLQQAPALQQRLRLVLVGEGPQRQAVQQVLEAARLQHLAWLPGERRDVPDVMRGLDCFALPSLAEGISNTILEAMATGLPVIAADVGGNAELLLDGRTGRLARSAQAADLAQALHALAGDPAQAAAMGRAGRDRAVQEFSLAGMVAAYQGLYESLLARHAGIVWRG